MRVRYAQKKPTSQKSDVMFCILCQGQWKATKLLAQAKLLAKDSKMKWKSSTSGESAPRKIAKSSNTLLKVVYQQLTKNTKGQKLN